MGVESGVLIVDDEPYILQLLEAFLGRQGFRVWLASNGAEALELYRSHFSKIAVVVLDVCMTGLDGPQTLAAMQTVNPQVRFCFMSGDPGAYPESELLDRGSPCVLKKPFRLEEIIHVIEQLAQGALPAMPSC
jgi:DNA-binding NtrC family response regulator